MASTRSSRTSPADRVARPRPDGTDDRSGAKVVVAVQRLFAAETREYFLLLGTTLFLVVFGLVMVLSSSSIQSRVDEGDFFSRAARQGLFALIGVPLMLLAARAPISFWKRWSWHALALGIGLQLLVFTGLGAEYGQNTNWIRFFGFTLQPSEFVKLALVVWLAYILTTKSALLHDWKHVALPILPVSLVAIGLVLLGNDLGTAVILVALTLGALFYAGIRLRIIGTAVLGVALLALVFAQGSLSRRNRIDAWMSGCARPEDYMENCWQTVHGWEALANGGVFGLGLGNSQYKWLWIPHAESDFIFAIVGEELGLVGALLVLVLFTILAVSLIRIVRMNRDPFAKIATSAVMIWIISQAFVNIGVVLGVLPVLGVPLPFMSAGGSALFASLVAIGVVLSFARHHAAPGAVAQPGGRGHGRMPS